MPRPNKVLQGCPHAWVFRPGSNGGLDYQISQTVFCENTGGISIEQIQFSLILSSKACCSFTIQKSPTARNNKNTLEEGQGKKREKKKERENTPLSSPRLFNDKQQLLGKQWRLQVPAIFPKSCNC